MIVCFKNVAPRMGTLWRLTYYEFSGRRSPRKEREEMLKQVCREPRNWYIETEGIEF